MSAGSPTAVVAASSSAEQPGTTWAYLAVISPIIFGTTYLLTTQFLPPDRPQIGRAHV